MSKTVVCVFCGASPGVSEEHTKAARALAQVFHQNDISLVYGGGSWGVMGALASELAKLSGDNGIHAIHGIIPRALVRHEKGTIKESGVEKEKTFGRTTYVDTLHERKQMMADEVRAGGPGSGFVALTGGFGTVEEIMEMTTWNQLNLHEKGLVLFNVEGFWNPLIQWIQNASTAGFINPNNTKILAVATTAEDVVRELKEYQLSKSRLPLDWTKQSEET